MSATAAILSTFAASTAAVAVPAAGIAIASSSDGLSPEMKSAVYLLGGLAWLVMLLGGIAKALPIVQSVLGIRQDKAADVRRPDHPLPSGGLVTRAEFERGIELLETRSEERSKETRSVVDDHAKETRKEVKELSDTMQHLLRDMAQAVGRLEGRASGGR